MPTRVHTTNAISISWLTATLLCGVITCGKSGEQSGADALVPAFDPIPVSCAGRRDTLSCVVQRFAREAREVLGGSLVSDPTGFESFLDSAVEILEDRIGQTRGDSARVDILKEYVYGDLGMAFDPNQDNIAGLLPHMAVSRRSGSCVGVSVLFLLLAERLDLPVHGVLIPTHFFVRYDNDTFRANIEPNKQGFPRSDSYYRRQYAISDSSWYDLRNLTTREVAAVLCYSLGNVYRESGHLGVAGRCYRMSIGGLKGLGEAYGNLAIVLDMQGQTRRAIGVLSEARRIRPGLKNASKNLGILYLKAGETGEALRELEAASGAAPDDPDVLMGLAAAYRRKGDKEAARKNARRAAELRPGWREAEELLRQL